MASPRTQIRRRSRLLDSVSLAGSFGLLGIKIRSYMVIGVGIMLLLSPLFGTGVILGAHLVTVMFLNWRHEYLLQCSTIVLAKHRN